MPVTVEFATMVLYYLIDEYGSRYAHLSELKNILDDLGNIESRFIGLPSLDPRCEGESDCRS